MKYVASLDVGTSGTRCLIFNINGQIIAYDYQEWNSFYPSITMVEQNAEFWWHAVQKSIINAIKKAKINTEDILSVAITNQRETIVPVDEKGNSLHNAIVWQDRRTIQECQWIKETIGEDKIYNKTGLIIDPYFSSSKILWFKNEKPHIYKRTHKFLLVHDYILYKLTGKFITDYSNASRTMLFDINLCKWSDEIANLMDIDLNKLPDAVPSGKVVGNIISSETGFSKKTIVVTGGGDQQCAALGVGVVQSGRMKCTTGTGSFILGYLNKPTFDPKKRVLCSCGVIPDSWVQEASLFSTGAALKWARDNIGAAELLESYIQKTRGNFIDPYDIITQQAAQSQVGSKGLIFIPHLIGAGAPHWNPEAKGIFYGLSLAHKTKDLYRSILEGVAYEIKKNIKIFEELGFKPQDLRVTGGGSRSSLWNQIIADVLNITCTRPKIEDSTAVGAAILAAYGTGEFPDINKASEQMSQMEKFWDPIEENNLQYDKLSKLSEKIYHVLNESKIYSELSDKDFK